MNRAQRRKHHYIYKITREDGKYYIGMHSTDDLEDGYFGSGTLLARSIRKHGKEKHSKEILEFLLTREALKLRERELVNEEILDDRLCMNLKLGGEGGWDHVKNQSVAGKLGAAAMKLKLATDVKFRAAFSRKCSEGNLKTYQNGREATGSFSGDLLNEMTTRAQSESAVKKRAETFRRINHQQGESNSQWGVRRTWIHRGELKKKVLRADVEQYLSDGWVMGVHPNTIAKRAKGKQKIRIERKGPNLSELICVSCSKFILITQRDVRRNRKYCSNACFAKRNNIAVF